MPLSYAINQNILFITCDCCFTRKDAIDCFKNAQNDQFFKEGMPVLIDTSVCKTILPVHAVKLILEFLVGQSRHFSSRFAFVEKNLSPFRLSRVFSATASDYGLQCRSFKKSEDAKEWLFESTA
jgi:hypothetical protein